MLWFHFQFDIKPYPLQTVFLLSPPRPRGNGFKPAYICVLVLHLMLSNRQRVARFLFALNVLALAAAAAAAAAVFVVFFLPLWAVLVLYWRLGTILCESVSQHVSSAVCYSMFTVDVAHTRSSSALYVTWLLHINVQLNTTMGRFFSSRLK